MKNIYVYIISTIEEFKYIKMQTGKWDIEYIVCFSFLKFKLLIFNFENKHEIQDILGNCKYVEDIWKFIIFEMIKTLTINENNSQNRWT